MTNILIVDDEENIRFTLKELLRRENDSYRIDEASDGEEAVARVRSKDYAVILMDLRMPNMDGMTALKKIRQDKPEAIVVVITAHGNADTAVEALSAGAYDYFTKPFELNEVRVVVRRAAEKSRLLHQIRVMKEESQQRYSFDRIMGQSASIQEVFKLINRVLDNDVTVLVTGESGTGKELVATAIHSHSHRAEKPIIKVNTVAIPEALLESELFGHERGAFTGAISQKPGKVELANGGTLFLDEIGDMSLPLQSKLLRVLQEREIERVGGTKSLKVDIRIIAATNRDLGKMVERGDFREDLYYRLNVMPLHLPPLRKRRDDIPVLIDHFIKQYNPKLNRQVESVSEGALQKLLNYSWPGNIRELENIMQRTILMSTGSMITQDDLPPSLRGESAVEKALMGELPQGSQIFEDLDLKQLMDIEVGEDPLADRLSRITDHLEKYLIRIALKKKKGHRQETADMLGISRKSLHNKMVRYGLFEEDVSS